MAYSIWQRTRPTQVFSEEGQRALACQLGRGCVPGAAVVAVEAVLRRVQVHLDLRVRLLEGFDAVQRHPLVAVGQVRHHRHLGLARDFVRLRHAAAVVGRGGRQAIQRARRAPGQQSAPAVADDADLAAAGLGGVVDGGLDVLHHAGCAQVLHRLLEAKALAHVGFGVAQLHARLDAVEGAGRHR